MLISQQTQYFISNCILFSLDLFMFTSSRFEIQPCRIISYKHTKVTGNNFIVFMGDNIRYFAKLCRIVRLCQFTSPSYSYCKILGDATINLAVSCKCAITLRKCPDGDYISLYQVLCKKQMSDCN